MKTILCYGDSNTWGYNPHVDGRYPFSVRWTGILEQLLGDCRVIEEGLCGRTTAFDSPGESYRNGLKSAELIIMSHCPVDLVILMLGTNDAKEPLGLAAEQIGEGMERLLSVFNDDRIWLENGGTKPQILLVAPAHIHDLTNSPFQGEFGYSAQEKSRRLANIYQSLAQTHHCLFLDAANHVRTDSYDEIHLDVDAHRMLAQAIAGVIKTSLS